MTAARGALREAISEKLVPALLVRGFGGPRSISGAATLHEYRRAGSDGTTQVLAIQFEKRGLPRFIVNLHVEPPTGIDNVVRRGGTIATARLQPRPGPTTRSWFRSDRSWWERVLLRRVGTIEEDAVQQCISLLPEVEQWFSARASSPHIVSSEVEYRGLSRLADEEVEG